MLTQKQIIRSCGWGCGTTGASAYDSSTKMMFEAAEPSQEGLAQAVSHGEASCIEMWCALRFDHTQTGSDDRCFASWLGGRGVQKAPTCHHINVLELLTVYLALKHFLPLLKNSHILVRTDNKATVAYINHKGGLRLTHMYQVD